MQPAFLPWHRTMLLHVERELQKLEPRVALHYWDWDAAAPNIFHEDFMGAPRTAAAYSPNPIFAIIEPAERLEHGSAVQRRRVAPEHRRITPVDPGGVR